MNHVKLWFANDYECVVNGMRVAFRGGNHYHVPEDMAKEFTASGIAVPSEEHDAKENAAAAPEAKTEPEPAPAG